MRNRLCLAFLSCILFIHISAQACRFNVRDVGMVDFSSIPYKLYGIVDDSISKEDQDAIRQIAYAAMLDSNIETELVHLQNDLGHQAITYYEIEGKPKLPALLLLSPNEDVIQIEWQNKDASFKDSVWSTMDYVAKSSFRETLLKECIHSFGIVLLIQGKNNDENNRAEQMCKSAVDKVTSNMDDLPKEIKFPPKFAKLQRKYFEQENLFLWSYGIDHQNVDEPMVAIVYGRGRQIGKILKGDEITSENVLSILSVIGLSCECGLDRSWMMGTMFPLIWNDEHRKLAMKNVGFDTESPMVKTEISQIMAKGSTTQKTDNGSRYASPDPLLGYAEISLEGASLYEEVAQKRDVDIQEEVAEIPIITMDVSTNSVEPETEVIPNSQDVINQLQHESTESSEPEEPVIAMAEQNTQAITKVEQQTAANTTTHVYVETKNAYIVKFLPTMFVVFGILGGVAIISGLAVLLITRGKQA